MIAIDVRDIRLEDFAQLHVRRWLILAFSGSHGVCKYDNLLKLTMEHPGHEADATLAEQWDLWECCLELASAYAVAKPR